MQELTEKQREVWDYLVDGVKKNGFQPSMQEIADHLEVDKNAVYVRIKALVRKGWIEQGKPKRDRGLVLKHVRFTPMYEVSSPL